MKETETDHWKKYTKNTNEEEARLDKYFHGLNDGSYGMLANIIRGSECMLLENLYVPEMTQPKYGKDELELLNSFGKL